MSMARSRIVWCEWHRCGCFVKRPYEVCANMEQNRVAWCECYLCKREPNSAKACRDRRPRLSATSLPLAAVLTEWLRGAVRKDFGRFVNRPYGVCAKFEWVRDLL